MTKDDKKNDKYIDDNFIDFLMLKSMWMDKVQLDPLSFGCNELEPVISEQLLLETREMHQATVNKLNELIKTTDEILETENLEEKNKAVEQFNSFGATHLNLKFLWQNITSKSKLSDINTDIGYAFVKSFGTFESF